MKRKNVRSVSALEILAAIGDEKSLSLFNAIAAKGISIEDLLNEQRMSRKQYYLRISKFIGAGMIKRVQLILLELIKSHWHPEAVDSLDSMKENICRECKKVSEDRMIENAAMAPISSTIVSSGVVK